MQKALFELEESQERSWRDLTLEEIEEGDGTDLPRRVGRFTRYKKESAQLWRLRLLQYIESGKIVLGRAKSGKSKTPADKLALADPEAVRALQSRYGLTQEQLLAYITPVQNSLPPSLVGPNARRRGASPALLKSLRILMHTWVQATYTRKVEEAILCDLQCLRCPAARAVACYLDNRSAMVHDGMSPCEVFGMDPYVVQPIKPLSTLGDTYAE